MIAAAVLMCTIQYGLPLKPCLTQEGREIAIAIDAATNDDGLKAHLVVYAWHESRFQFHPRAKTWDALAGIAKGPWQLWVGGDGPAWLQARRWLWCVQRAGLPSVDSSPSRAYRRALEAQRLLDQVLD
jgi:hypothetical protein